MKTYVVTIEQADGSHAVCQLAAENLEVGDVVTGVWHDHEQLKHRVTGKVLRIATI